VFDVLRNTRKVWECIRGVGVGEGVEMGIKVGRVEGGSKGWRGCSKHRRQPPAAGSYEQPRL
jgi:hypothetical protein